MNWKLAVGMIVSGAVLCAMAVAQKADTGTGVREGEANEGERTVTQAEVSPAALAALQKLAAGAEINEFARETKHGVVRYEGSWTTEAGVKIDALVTQAGALLELEEQRRAALVQLSSRGVGTG